MIQRVLHKKKGRSTGCILVSGAWRKFNEWWDVLEREAVEKKTRESILGKLAELKKEIAEQPRKTIVQKQHRGPERE